MSRFPSDRHICPWAGLRPVYENQRTSGKKRAYVAVAHPMVIAIYHILKDGVVFKDFGAEYYNQFNKERKINAYLKKIKALGWGLL